MKLNEVAEHATSKLGNNENDFKQTTEFKQTTLRSKASFGPTFNRLHFLCT